MWKNGRLYIDKESRCSEGGGEMKVKNTDIAIGIALKVTLSVGEE